MRRRKKDKTKDKVPTNSAEHDTPDSSGRGGSSGSKSSKDADASNSGVTVTVSPPQQRKRSLLGSLGSMRDLVEQVSSRGYAGLLTACTSRALWCLSPCFFRVQEGIQSPSRSILGTFRIAADRKGLGSKQRNLIFHRKCMGIQQLNFMNNTGFGVDLKKHTLV